MCPSKSSTPILAQRLGFVVTPSSTPRSLASLISFRSAVSIKNFMSAWEVYNSVYESMCHVYLSRMNITKPYVQNTYQHLHVVRLRIAFITPIKSGFQTLTNYLLARVWPVLL